MAKKKEEKSRWVMPKGNKTHGIIALVMVLVVALLIFFPPTSYNTDTMAKKNEQGYSEAVFAGGCFWCMEKDFEKIDGVIDAVSGYSGGTVDNPTYQQVSSGSTGHREVIKVIYDSSKVSYKELLEHFWINIDPFNDRGQFCDTGFQYTAAIYYANNEEKELAEESKMFIEMYLDSKPVTEIVKLDKFFDAEDYHQGYYKSHSLKYKTYRFLCGRDKRLHQVWMNKTVEIFDEDLPSDYKGYVKPSDTELKKVLTDIQYKVTQKDGTERPFNNEYWDNKEHGIYVDILSGEPLFSSTDKYKSGTGWPSFTKPLAPENVVTKTDYKIIIPRTEVRSKHADNHIGHVFKDGPEPTGLRYCMNSAAMRFIPASDLEKEGYEEYSYLFE